ncbi:hypothetical protein ACFC34_34880 [Streptomyces sp. NPDC056053]
MLDDPLAAPRRFDSVERARIEYSPRASKTAREIYSTEGVLFVRGAKNSFKAMFSQLNETLAKWTFWWSLDSMTGPSGEKWLNWLYRLSGKLPPYYGFACSVDEYEAKHKVVEADEAGSSIQMSGVSSADFQRFLPGIYWLTIFGKDLADHFDPELHSLPEARRVRIPPSQVAVLLDSPVVPESMDERLRTEARLAKILGAQYFFDHARAEGEYALVPQLARAMREAASE